MIKSFKCKETKKLFQRKVSHKLPIDIQRLAMRKLWLIDAAENINDLRIPPSDHLEKLKGDRKGQYSIRINNRWRICFEWRGNNSFKVEIIDYH